MDQALKDKYEINFHYKIIVPRKGKRYFVEIPDTNHAISSFLAEWEGLHHLKEFLADVDDVLNGTSAECESASHSIDLITIGPKITMFYSDYYPSGYIEMPTSDFRTLVAAWIDFASKPIPLFKYISLWLRSVFRIDADR